VSGDVDDRPQWFRDDAGRLRRGQLILLAVSLAVLAVLLGVGAIAGPGPWVALLFPVLVVISVAHYYFVYRGIRLGAKARRAGIKPRYDRYQVWGNVILAVVVLGLSLPQTGEHWWWPVLGAAFAAWFVTRAIKAHRQIRDRQRTA
jgi:hypothetical protein